MIKVLILVLAENKTDYFIKSISEIRETYFNIVDDRIVDKLFYFGDSNKTFIENDILYCNTNECFGNIIHKTHECFRYALEKYNFDYILRLNSGVYCNIKLMCDLIESLPRVSVFGGVIGHHLGHEFVSGSGYIVSRDLVEYFTTDENYINNIYIDEYIDDVSLSIYFKNKKINFTQIDFRQDYFSYNSDVEFINNLNINKCLFYFRSINNRLFKKIHNKIWN